MVIAGVDDLPCFTAFLFFGPYSNLKFIIFTYTCTIENTLFHSEQISAAGAKSPQTSSYVSNLLYCGVELLNYWD